MKFLTKRSLDIFSSEQLPGLILIACAVVSLVLANSGVIHNYSTLWQYELPLPHWLPATPHHIINEGLMTFFFFMAGLEIKQELTTGELNTVKKALMPVISALGGMLAPAFIYLLFCNTPPGSNGWGIPMATDIAFSLALLSLAGSNVTRAMRAFLTSIAVIDDIGGIITIAVFYPSHINPLFLVSSLAVTFALFIIQLSGKGNIKLFLGGGLMLWFCMFNAGISPAVAGVITAFMVAPGYRHTLAHSLQKPVNYIILPLFALANTALQLPANVGAVVFSTVTYGIVAGLVVGKPLGIYLFTRLALWQKLGELPAGLSNRHLLAVAIIAGIGFTVSLFIAPLAFPKQGQTELLSAGIGILAGSFISGIAGFYFVRLGLKAKK